MRKILIVSAVILLFAIVLLAVDVIGNMNIAGTLTASIVDFRSAQSTAPIKMGTSLPASCSLGQLFFKSDAVAGANIYLCTATNTWTQVSSSGGGGSSTFNWKPDPRYTSLISDMANIQWNSSSAYDGGFFLYRSAGSQNLNNPAGSGASYGELGLATISTTTTSGNMTRYQANISSHGFASGYGLYANTSKSWEVVIRFRYPNATDSSASSMAIGMTGNSATTTSIPPSGLGVRYLAGTDSYLTLYTSGSDGVWTSTVSSGVAPGTSFHTLRIRSSGTQNYRILMSIDGGTEVDVCPTGCSMPLGSSSDSGLTSMHFTIRTDEAAQKLLQIDYISFWLDRGEGVR